MLSYADPIAQKGKIFGPDFNQFSFSFNEEVYEDVVTMSAEYY